MATNGNSSLVPSPSRSSGKIRATGLPRILRLNGFSIGLSNGSMWVGNGPSRISLRLKKRLVPSGFMMNGPTSRGLAVSPISGTSAPTQRSPFHSTITRSGSHGRPSRSQEARLYRVRRLAGQENDQFACTPMPLGSLLSRRAIMLPSSVQLPV